VEGHRGRRRLLIGRGGRSQVVHIGDVREGHGGLRGKDEDGTEEKKVPGRWWRMMG
jgi:hypothetical protein